MSKRKHVFRDDYEKEFANVKQRNLPRNHYYQNLEKKHFQYR